MTGGEHILGLTPRQQGALLFIEESRGVTLDELGAWLHHRQGKHSPDLRCEWCQDTGAGIAHELKKKNLVRRLRGGTWESTRPLDREEGLPGASSSTTCAPASSPSSGPDPAHATEPTGAAPLSQTDEIPY